MQKKHDGLINLVRRTADDICVSLPLRLHEAPALQAHEYMRLNLAYFIHLQGHAAADMTHGPVPVGLFARYQAALKSIRWLYKQPPQNDEQRSARDFYALEGSMRAYRGFSDSNVYTPLTYSSYELYKTAQDIVIQGCDMDNADEPETDELFQLQKEFDDIARKTCVHIHRDEKISGRSKEAMIRQIENMKHDANLVLNQNAYQSDMMHVWKTVYAFGQGAFAMTHVYGDRHVPLARRGFWLGQVGSAFDHMARRHMIG